MLQEFTLTPATIVIAVLVIAWVVWAIRRLTRRGMCDCGDKCDGCSHKVRSAGANKASASAACSHCSAADDMVARMESSLNE